MKGRTAQTLLAGAALLAFVTAWLALEYFVFGHSPRDLAPGMAVYAAFLGLIVGVRQLTGGRTLRARRLAARDLGLHWKGRVWTSHGTITGVLNGLHVVVRDEGRQFKERIEIALPSLPPTMTLAPSSSRGERAPSAVETGDGGFDSDVELSGVAAWQILPGLDGRTRALVRRLVVEDGFVIREGRLTRETAKPTRDARTLARLLSDAAALGEALDVPDRSQSAQCLARRAREDADPHVRRRCLQVLSASFPALPLALETCRDAQHDHSPWVRLQAAMGLDEEGIEPLQALLERASCPDTVMAAGLKHLLSAAPHAAVPHLVSALKGDKPAARIFAAAALGNLRHLAALGPLATLAETAHEETALVAVNAITAMESAEAEKALVRTLRRVEPSIRAAAVHGLRQIGTVEAVPALRALADEEGVARDLRHAALDAVRAVQARLVGAEEGLLALAGTDGAGRLSLAFERRGELALNQDERAATLRDSPEKTTLDAHAHAPPRSPEADDRGGMLCTDTVCSDGPQTRPNARLRRGSTKRSARSEQ